MKVSENFTIYFSNPFRGKRVSFFCMLSTEISRITHSLTEPCSHPRSLTLTVAAAYYGAQTPAAGVGGGHTLLTGTPVDVGGGIWGWGCPGGLELGPYCHG